MLFLRKAQGELRLAAVRRPSRAAEDDPGSQGRTTAGNAREAQRKPSHGACFPRCPRECRPSRLAASSICWRRATYEAPAPNGQKAEPPSVSPLMRGGLRRGSGQRQGRGASVPRLYLVVSRWCFLEVGAATGLGGGNVSRDQQTDGIAARCSRRYPLNNASSTYVSLKKAE